MEEIIGHWNGKFWTAKESKEEKENESRRVYDSGKQSVWNNRYREGEGL